MSLLNNGSDRVSCSDCNAFNDFIVRDRSNVSKIENESHQVITDTTLGYGYKMTDYEWDSNPILQQPDSYAGIELATFI